MTHQQDLDNHANQLNPNNDAFWESRGYDEGPDDRGGGSGSARDDDDSGGGDEGPSASVEKERQEPKKRILHLTCSNCRKESDMVAEEVDAGFGRTWERSRCPSCGTSVAIDGAWAMRLADGTAMASASAPSPEPPSAPVTPSEQTSDLALQDAVIGYLSEAGHDNLPTWALYRVLGVQSRSPSYSVEQFATFLDGMVSRRLILSDRVFRVQRYV